MAESNYKYLIEVLAEISGLEDIKILNKALKDMDIKAKKLKPISSPLSSIKLDEAGKKIKSIKNDLVDITSGKKYQTQIDFVFKKGKLVDSIAKIKQVKTDLEKPAVMPVPKTRGWKTKFSELVSTVGDVKKVVSTELVKTTKIAGKEARKFAIVWQNEAGEKFKTTVKGIIQDKKLLDAKLSTAPVKSKEIKSVNLKVPVDDEAWRRVAVGFPREFKQFDQIISTSLQEISTKSGQTSKKFAVDWKDKVGKQYRTFVSGVVKQNRLMNASFRTVPRAITTAKKEMGDFIKALRRVMIVVPIWFAFRRIFISVLELIKSSVSFLIDWEQQLAQIRIVGKGTEEGLQGLSKVLLELSKNLGISTKELGKASVLWAQQGRNYAEIIPLMQTTAKLSLITGRTMTQSVEDLTSIMKAFSYSAESTSNVVDSLTNAMLNHAVTAGVLVEAMRNVAPVAKQFNISFEEMIGIITATHAVTRSKGATIGKAWRTIFARMGTSAAETIQEIAKVPVFLDEEGKASEVATYRMRNLGQVLTEIALKWNTLTEAQKINLGQALAGKRRMTELMAFMGNYNEALKAHLDALLGVGKADRSVAILTDTLANRLQGLSGAWKDMVDAIGSTDLMKGGVSVMTKMLAGIANFLDPINAKYKEQLALIEKSNSKLNRQYGLVNAQLQIWKESRRLADFFKKEPSLAKKLEPNLVSVFVEKMRQAGIEIDRDVTSMDALAKIIEDRIPQATANMADTIHKQTTNKLKTEILGMTKILAKTLQDQMAIVADTLGNMTPEFVVSGLKFKGTGKEYEKLASIYEKLSNQQQLAVDDIKLLAKYVSSTNMEYKKQMATLDLLKKMKEKILNLEKQSKDKSNAELQAKAKVNALTKEETTNIITAEEARLGLLAIEKKSLLQNQERIVTVNKLLDFLNKENVVLDDELRKKKDSLELEKLKLSISEGILKLKQNLNEIENAGKENRRSELQILKEKLNYVKLFNVENDKDLKKLKEQLEIQIASVEAKNRANILAEKENMLLEQMKAYGADALQLEIQRYEIMKARGADGYELETQALKIQKQMIDDINASAAELGDMFKSAFSDFILGEKEASEIFDSFIDNIRKSLASAISENLKNQLFAMTGIGSNFGKLTAGLKGNPAAIDKAFIDGSQITYRNILEAHREGSKYFADTVKGEVSSMSRAIKGGAAGGVGLPVAAASTGFFGGMTFKQGLGSFLSGALAGSGGGLWGSLTGGFSSLFTMAGHPLLGLTSLLLGGLFRKKKTIIQETPKEVAGKQALNLGVQVPSLPKLYALPQSYYFNASINVNIDKIQGEGAEVADKIASEVSKATQEAFKKSYVRNITRAVLPKGYVF